MTPEEKALFGIDKLNVPRSEIPAVTHVDYSARIQTVHQDTNPRYYALLSAFERKTGCPVLVNTSFNVCGEGFHVSGHGGIENNFTSYRLCRPDSAALHLGAIVKEQRDRLWARNFRTRFRRLMAIEVVHSSTLSAHFGAGIAR